MILTHTCTHTHTTKLTCVYKKANEEVVTLLLYVCTCTNSVTHTSPLEHWDGRSGPSGWQEKVRGHHPHRSPVLKHWWQLQHRRR